ncbi:MAG: type IV pilus modification PilV family protein [Candidatus Saccharimonadales bacterium]
MINILRKHEDGDTIVEVLISLAILVLVLGGAYYTASQSYRNDRDSQEHTEGLTIAQTQIEALRIYGDTFNPTNDSCLQPPDSPSNSCYVSSSDTSKFYPNLNNCQAQAPYCYRVTISQPGGPPVTINQHQSPAPTVTVNTYIVTVTWPALAGGTDNVTLNYRLDS